MGRPNKQIKLLDTDKSRLETIVTKGKNSARMITRCWILLKIDEGVHISEIAKIYNVHENTVRSTIIKYEREGIETAINEKFRPGQPRKVTSNVEAHITAIACSTPPSGYAQWTLRLISDKLIELEVVDTISTECVRKTLKKAN